MPHDEFEKQDSQHIMFQGIFEGIGQRQPRNASRPEPTVFFSDIRADDGTLICDRLWFALTEEFEELNLEPGDVVQFSVQGDDRGNAGQHAGQWLYHPTKVTGSTLRSPPS